MSVPILQATQIAKTLNFDQNQNIIRGFTWFWFCGLHINGDLIKNDLATAKAELVLPKNVKICSDVALSFN
jgi:hypothetical protein